MYIHSLKAIWIFGLVNLETLLHPQVWMEVSIQHKVYTFRFKSPF